MLQDPATIEPALDLILVSRHLERIGDHATNIAEDVIFMVSAKDVRHHAGRRSAASHRVVRLAVRCLRPIEWPDASRDAVRRICRQRPADPAWRPFCSERCKLADLARWLAGDYRVRPPTSRRRPTTSMTGG